VYRPHGQPKVRARQCAVFPFLLSGMWGKHHLDFATQHSARTVPAGHNFEDCIPRVKAMSSELKGDFREFHITYSSVCLRGGCVCSPAGANRAEGRSLDGGRLRSCRVVKIFKCVEESRSSMMDIEDEHNHMRAASRLRDRIGQPGTPAAE
jgi:hypothetical protein